MLGGHVNCVCPVVRLICEPASAKSAPMKTKSESLFEEFLATNNLSFEKIDVDTTPRPDYRITVGCGEIIFELKELAEDGNFGVIKDPNFPHIKSSSRTVGDHIRRRIESSRKQIQFGATAR